MIILKNVNKNLGDKEVLKDITFHIAPCERVGIIGLNGAGKSTLLNVISGLIKPDSGFIRVDSVEDTLSSKSVLKNMIYASGTKSQLWEDMKIKDSLRNCISMYKSDEKNLNYNKNIQDKYKELIELFEVEELLDSIPRELSLGERMRCEMVYSLLANPKIIMLDEVMIGLDVAVKYKVMRYLEEYCKQGNITFIYTSHNLVEVEKLCDRIILIDEGRIIFDGSLDKIMREYAPLYRIRIDIEDGMIDFEDLPIEMIRIEKGIMDILYDKSKINTAQILKFIMANSYVKDVKIYEPDLEGTIKNIHRKQKVTVNL